MGKEPDTYTGNSLESALVRNAVSVGYHRGDKRNSRPVARLDLGKTINPV